MLNERALILWPAKEAEKYRKYCWKNQTILDRLVEASLKHDRERPILGSADHGGFHSYTDPLDGQRGWPLTFQKSGLNGDMWFYFS